jgi:hypothetical protein
MCADICYEQLLLLPVLYVFATFVATWLPVHVGAVAHVLTAQLSVACDNCMRYFHRVH